MKNQEREVLRAFRTQVYRNFGCRRDGLFELMDAVLTTPVIESPAHLSLAAAFRRKWGSIYDALNAGTMNTAALATLIAQYPLAPTTQWYAIDASVWPRCDAETSPERGYYHHHSRHSNGQPIVAGWNDSWLVQVPERCSRWTAPMRVRRVVPGENSNQIAAEQIRSHQQQCEQQGRRKAIYSFDAGYDPIQIAEALADSENICLLIRLRAGRCFLCRPSQHANRRAAQAAWSEVCVR